MAVIIYALTNPAMPNLVKIGKTESQDPQVRMDQLYNTSVPLPFELVRAIRVQDEDAVEKKIHAVFSNSRINPKREFFEISLEQVKHMFDLIVSDGSEDVSIEASALDTGIDADSKLAADSFKRKRRPNLNFREMGIPVGARLSFRNDEAVVVQVVDDRKVRMDDGEARSLTSVTQAVLETEYSIAPAPQWRYNGRLLSEIYDETYGT